jgi:cyclopropane fatty-acyl-phospholipid synthase-like methyltransferase
MTKPHAESCDRNRDPILEVIAPLLADKHSVLEVGSGTGQHAIYFAAKLPHLTWHTSDRLQNHEAIQQWLDEEALDNVRGPIELDVLGGNWPELEVDAVFSANTAHIMHWNDVKAFFAGVGELLPPGGLFMLYGPFSYGGLHTSESNARFDLRLKQQDPQMGIRDFDDLDALAQQAGLEFQHDYPMPANNRILLWKKI